MSVVPSFKHVHIDADSIVYRIGAVHDNQEYVLDGSRFKYKKDLIKHCTAFAGLGCGNPDDAVKEKTPSPLMIVLGAIDNSIREIKKGASSDENCTLTLHLTGGNQFRDEIATIQPYKGNRDSVVRPHWYEQIRDHMVNKWGAIIHEVIEADDAVCMELHACNADDSTVIAGIDKDLLQTEGWHYNFDKKVHTFVSEHDGWVSFYNQLASGDSVDNIAGLKRLTGKNKPRGVLEALQGLEYPEDMFRYVFGLYVDNHKTSKNPVEWTYPDLYDQLHECGELLYMRRYDADRYKHVLNFEEVVYYVQEEGS